jgi:hypothetical protein
MGKSLTNQYQKLQYRIFKLCNFLWEMDTKNIIVDETKTTYLTLLH